MQNTNIALEILFDITRQTVGELQQLFVKGWKEAGGGKLSEEQIEMLRQELFVLVKKKLDQPTQDLLTAAGADINALISGAAGTGSTPSKRRATWCLCMTATPSTSATSPPI